MESGDGMVETGGETDQIPGVQVVDGETAAVVFASWDKDANIHMRLLHARADAKRMEKKGTHEIRKDGKKVGGFGYVKGDDITNEGNRLFVKHGICPLPTAVERIEEALTRGLKTTIKCELCCVNVDNSDEFVIFTAWGTGIDYSDKGDGKAYSYAVKYATAKALGLNTSDDIEEHDTEYEKRASEPEVAKAHVGVKAQMKSWADNLKAAINGAQTLSELKEIQRNNRIALMAEDLPEVTREYFIDEIEARKVALTE